jgi:hypothetical protein
MKKHILALTFALFSFLGIAQWNFVGVAGISSGWAPNELETDTTGHPVVVFRESVLQKASCLRFDGTQWVPVGTPTLEDFPIELIDDFIIDKNNYYYLLFTNTNYELSCLMYDGKIWKYVGSQKIMARQSVHTTMAIDSKGVVYVGHPTNSGFILLKEKDGIWIPYSTTNLPPFIAFPSLKFDNNDVAYMGYTGDGLRVNCSKLINGTWVTVGNSNFSSEEAAAFYTTLHITKSNQVYVGVDDPYISCYKLDGVSNTWKKIGDTGLGGNHGGLNDLISDSNSSVYISTSHISGDKAMCFTFNGTNWVMVGNSPISESYASSPNISINKYGKIFAGYSDANLNKTVIKEYSLFTGTGGLVNNDRLKLYPNPSNGHFFIELPGEKFTISIYDTNGILIIEYQNINNNVSIDSKTFRKGVYLVSVKTQNRQHHYRKLIIT